MKKTIVCLDAGHGGIVNGNYVTPGKRSPKFDDGSQLFEGVYNRAVLKKLSNMLEDNLFIVHNVSPGEIDTPLSGRVHRANAINAGKDSGQNCLYISLHGDAAGDGENWHPASGMSVYTSKGQTKSDTFAELVIDSLKDEFQSETKWRIDNTDGDSDKEENFYVLKNTSSPAVLVESGFMTNKDEATKMMTSEWQERVARSIYNAIVKWEEKNK